MASPNHNPKLPILTISYLSRFPLPGDNPVRRGCPGTPCGSSTTPKACSAGSSVPRLVRYSAQPSDGEGVLCDQLIVLLNGEVIRIPADPPELLPMLAETENLRVSLVGSRQLAAYVLYHFNITHIIKCIFIAV